MTKTRSADQALAADAPQPVVTTVDAIALTVGIVIGAGIFRTPALIAANSASEWTVYLAWALGGIISVMGALVYSELATTYPHAGGDYHYLTRAFGHRLSFLFAWARMSVIQTGAITFSLFVFGDYLSEIFSLGTYSSAIYAGLAIVALTVLNITGVREGTGTQNFLTSIEVLGVILVIVAGLLMVPAPQAIANTPGASLSSSSFGLVMVFVLLTYGGWGEAAYVSAELRDVRRNMVRVLMLSILLITTLYLLINWAYLHALGLAGTAKAEQVGAVIMNRAFGERGAEIISLLIAISALTTANATVFTGARTSYAFGCTGISLFVLRRKESGIARPFRVPLYPVTPILFCLASAYLLYSSLAYTRIGALAGVAVLTVGAVLLLFVRPVTVAAVCDRRS